LVQSENTPKAFANFSPGFEAKQEPWVTIYSSDGTLKGFRGWRTLSGLRISFDVVVPKVVASSNLGLKLANAFGIFFSH